MSLSVIRGIPLGLLLALAAFNLIGALVKPDDMDGRVLYYGSRCLFAGENPYDPANRLAQWQRDHAPERLKPDPKIVSFVNPPSMALLLAPAALLPWRFGIPAIRLLDVLGALVILSCLNGLSSPTWSKLGKATFAGAFFAMPSVTQEISGGQSSLIVCALLAGMLLALRIGRKGFAALLLGISLAKFTLAIPLLILLFYRKQWAVLFGALSAFLATNLAVSFSVGPVNILTAWIRAIREGSRPGGMLSVVKAPGLDNDSASIHAERLLYSLLGGNLPLVKIAYVLFAVAALAWMGWLFRRTSCDSAQIEPLEICVCILGAFAAFYHRSYDLVGLVFAAFGLIEYRLRSPERINALWGWSMGLACLMAFGMGATGGSSGIVQRLFESIGIAAPKPIVVLLGFCLVSLLLARDKALQRDENGKRREPAVSRS